MLCHLRTAVVSLVLFVCTVTYSTDFEAAPPPYTIYDESRKLEDVPTYKPKDQDVNAFQEIEMGTSSFLFIGAREMVVTVLQNNVSIEEAKDVFSRKENPIAGALPCETVAKGDPDYLCKNYITVLQPILDNKVIVCGTNGLVPVCYNCHLNATNNLQCPADTNTGNNIIECPADGSTCYYIGDAGLVAHNPIQDTAWLYLEENGDDLGPVVYTGANEELNKDSVISRVQIVNGKLDLRTDKVIKTDKDDPDWLNNAEFVGDPIEYGEHVYFFFRETATEYINAGKIVYSRVGRVCKNDTGGGAGSMLDGKWTTFQKARLNCSTQGDFPFYFNELQDIYQASNYVREVIYSIFTTPQTGATGSAVCVFRLDEMQQLFDNGAFKGAESPAELWLPVDNSKVPSPRPGRCAVHPTTDYPFIKKYPLMDALVPNTRTYASKQEYDHVSNSPLGIIQGVRIVELVVDEQVMDAGGVSHDIFFLASDDGRIFKMYMASPDDPVLIEEFDLMLEENEEVITMKLKDGLLYVGTEERVVSVPVQYCDTYAKCYLCVQAQDPYCSWTGAACEAETSGGKQCLRETRDKEPYECGNNGDCDWPKPMIAYVSERETYVIAKGDIPINLYFTATGPRYSNLDYSFSCECDNGEDCTDWFDSTPKYQRLAKVEWVSVTFVSREKSWKSSCNATATYTATANEEMESKTSRIEVDSTNLINDPVYSEKLTNYDEMMAAYQYDVKMWEEDAIKECYPDDISTCSP